MPERSLSDSRLPSESVALPTSASEVCEGSQRRWAPSAESSRVEKTRFQSLASYTEAAVAATLPAVYESTTALRSERKRTPGNEHLAAA